MEIRNAQYRSGGAHALKFVDADGNPELSLTKQADRDQTDINKIMSRYSRTGLIDHVAKGKSQYGDFTTVNEYQMAMNTVIAAQQSFADLPSKVRERFRNDPGEFFEFVSNPDNVKEMIELGLAEPAPGEPKPMRVEVVNPSVSGDSPK